VQRHAVLEVPTSASRTPYRVTLHGEAQAGNTRPSVAATSAPSVEGSKPVLSVPFTDPDAGDVHTALVIWPVPGGQQPNPVPATVVPGPGGGTVTATAPSVAPDDGELEVVVMLSDGKESAPLALVTLPVVNAVPQVDLGQPVTLAVGERLDRAGTFTDPGADTWTATVDTGDGPRPLPLSGKGFTVGHSWDRPGTYPVTVAVTDDDGGTGTAVLQVTVRSTNTAPTLSLGEPVTVAEGAPFARTVTVVDPDADTVTATVDTGDGTGPRTVAVNGRTLELAHTWIDDGAYAVTVEVSDGKGGTATQALPVRVTNVAPTVVITGPAAGTPVLVGRPVALTGTVTDPGVGDVHTAGWTVDTTEVAAQVDQATGAVTGTWTPTAAGVYPVALTVDDGDGGRTTARTMVLVEDTAGGQGKVTAGGGYDAPGGRVHLGLVARTTGTNAGQVLVQLPDQTVKSTRVERVTVTGDRVDVRGTARGAGERELAYVVSLVDARSGDLVRVRVTDRATGAVVHDSQPGAADGAAPTTRLQGSVTLHR
jgi:hypothetical protein